MDAKKTRGSATAESNLIYDKFLVTPLKNGSGSLGGEYCDPCSPWLGDFVLGWYLYTSMRRLFLKEMNINTLQK